MDAEYKINKIDLAILLDKFDALTRQMYYENIDIVDASFELDGIVEQLNKCFGRLGYEKSY